MTTLTKYQQAIIEAVEARINTPGSKKGLLVEALAGTGKSFTLAQIAYKLDAMGVPSPSCRFVVFGKKNQLDLAAKIGQVGKGWEKSVQTLSSLGYTILREGLGRSHKYFNLSSSKYLFLARDLGYLDKRDRDGNHDPGSLTYSENSPIQSDRYFVELLEKLRLHCYGPDDIDIEAIQKLDARYSWEFKGHHLQEIARAAAHCLAEGMEAVERTGKIDFLDMIFYPCLYKDDFAGTFASWSSQLKFVAVDEAQDTDELQINFLKLLHNPANNFLCAVGDRNQAIYYFRGCLSNGLDYLAKNFDCETLPLPINYRCGKNHLALVREVFPRIKIETHSEAPDGEIRCLRSSQLMEVVGDRSLSYFGIARKNAPLLSSAIQFLTNGIPAKIKDKSLGDRVLRTLEQVVGSKKKYDSFDFLDKLETWQDKQLKKYSSETKHQEINDLTDCLKALFDAFELNSFEDWEDKLKEIFDEARADEKPIDLYTIHSGKGGEGEVSFLINADEMPLYHKKQSEEERDQEQNMIYVALTRCMANSKQGSGVFYLLLQEDDETGEPKYPEWLPKKYCKIWGETEEPEETIDAAAEESEFFSGEAEFDGTDEVWDCPVCDADNFETATCYQCGYERFPEDDDDIPFDSDSSLEIEETPQSVEPIEVLPDSLELPSPPISFTERKGKGERVREILLSGSQLSGEAIAEMVGCSAMLVSKTRKKLEGEGLLQRPDVVLSKNGRAISVANIGTQRADYMAKARAALEELTGPELRALFEEFLGYCEEEENADIPF